MAIKVKHEGNVTSRVVAANLGGEAKARQERALQMKQVAAQENMAANRQLQGAHASPVGASAPAAHTGSASLMAAPARGGASGGDYKVTGTNPVSRPDAESRWDPDNGGRWIRKWQPGEKEAEARARVGAVEEQFQIGRENRAIQAKKDLAEFQYTQNQRQQYAKLQGIRDTLLNSGMYSKDDIDAMMPAIDMRMNGIRDNPERMLPQDRKPVPELQFSPDGKFYFDDAGGKWTPMPREQTQGPAGPTPEQSYKLRELGAAQKNYQNDLRAWNKAKASYDEGVGEDPGPRPEFDEDAELQKIGGRWNSVVGQPASSAAYLPQSQPMPVVMPELPIQSIGLNTNVVPQSVSQPVAPNPHAIQSVGPDATPEQKARNWAARLRKQ